MATGSGRASLTLSLSRSQAQFSTCGASRTNVKRPQGQLLLALRGHVLSPATHHLPPRTRACALPGNGTSTSTALRELQSGSPSSTIDVVHTTVYEANWEGDGEVPLMDPRLTAADRAVLALSRAVASLGDKQLAESCAAQRGLQLVTGSDTAVAPLLPPFGGTVDEELQQGDGMAAVRGEDASAASQLKKLPKKAAGAFLNTLLTAASGNSAAAASVRASSAASAGLEKLLGGRSDSGDRSASRGGRSAGAGGRGGAGAQGREEAAAARMASGMMQYAAGEGGGETTDDEVAMGGSVAPPRPAAAAGGSSAASGSAQRSGSSGGKAGGAAGGGVAGGLFGAAAVALNQVARAASSAAEMPAPAAVGRAASAAASAAQAAVASAAKIIPRGGESSGPLLPSSSTSSWLVADDPAARVRYVVVGAGPDLRRRSGRDLAADLTTFEAYGLGIKVNRRLYAEATSLYGRFMPLVLDYLEATPGGQVCFGGQGVGGALAVLLQLMAVSRGLRYSTLLPAVAVDAPAVLGQVPQSQRRMWGTSGAVEQDQLADVLEDLMARNVLEDLGLPQDAVRNVILTGAGTSASSPSSLGGAAGMVWDALRGPKAAAAAQQQPGQGGKPDGPVVVVDRGGPEPTAQVFKLVGKVVHVEGLGAQQANGGNGTGVGAVRATGGSFPFGAGLWGGASGSATAAGGGGGAAAGAKAAAEGEAAAGERPSGAGGKLDAAMVGGIAAAAATAAASAAADKIGMMMGGGGGGAPGQRVSGVPVVESPADDDDASAWGV